jgi:hypothetical protein
MMLPPYVLSCPYLMSDGTSKLTMDDTRQGSSDTPVYGLLLLYSLFLPVRLVLFFLLDSKNVVAHKSGPKP